MQIRARYSSYVSLALFLALPLVFGSGQEIFAPFLPHDDYYFILKAGAWGMDGNQLAPIKEILYPLYIRLSWVFGLSLRNFEALCYGLALFSLWREVSALTGNKLVAYGTVLPLALFCHQHAVFNHATYDALQLILMPLTFSSAILIFRKSGNNGSLAFAGPIIAAHALTRPEGFLFVLPPAVSLLWVTIRDRGGSSLYALLKRYLPKFAVLLAALVLSQQLASAINWYYLDFWAPTIIKAPDFQKALSALMELQTPAASRQRYAPVPKSTLELAFKLSPTFNKAKPFFEQNLDGRGWSAHALPGYRPDDGSIGGGQFQWALLDAGTFVMGPKADNILRWTKRVARELNEAMAHDGVPHRRLLSTALGPNFTVMDRGYWESLAKVGRSMVLPVQPVLPMMPGVLSKASVESDFDRLTLRRRGLLEATRWQLSGWIVDMGSKLPPYKIELDAGATRHGIDLKTVERLDVARAQFGMHDEENRPARYGIELSSPGPWTGNMLLRVLNGVETIPLEKLQDIGNSRGYQGKNVYLHVDSAGKSQSNSSLGLLPFTTWMTRLAFDVVAVLIPVAGLVILISPFAAGRLRRCGVNCSAFGVVTAITASIVLPRLLLLAGVDAFMYPGAEVRYVTAGVFAVWVLATFTAAYGLVAVHQFFKAKADTS